MPARRDGVHRHWSFGRPSRAHERAPARRVDAAVTDLTRDFPALAEARTLAPAFYGRLLDAVGDALDAGGSDQAAVDAGRAVVRQYYREKLPGVPDALLLRVLQLTLAEAREAARSSPQLCVDLLLGMRVGDRGGARSGDRVKRKRTFQAVLGAPALLEALAASDDAVAQAVASAPKAGAAMLGMPA